jgi:glycosyltransferase involved in cell wall biosynthesis
MRPLVSVLIPAYNAQDSIQDTIESAASQTWRCIEIIVVDDGSTDRTLSVCRQFESPLIKVVPQSNQGASAARNTALALAQGDYIQWLDADDILAPDKVEHQMQRVAQGVSGATLLSSAWYKFYYRISAAKPAKTGLWQDLQPNEWAVRSMSSNAWMGIQSWLVSRELISAIGKWDETLSADDDGEYVSRLICASDRILFVSEAESYVRQSNLGSLSKNSHSERKVVSQYRSMLLQIENWLRLDNSPAMRSACVEDIQRWIIYFYPEYRTIVDHLGKLVRELGGELRVPTLSWKYRPVQRALGWGPAKHLMHLAPQTRTWCTKTWDKLLFSLSNEREAGVSRPPQDPSHLV